MSEQDINTPPAASAGRPIPCLSIEIVATVAASGTLCNCGCGRPRMDIDAQRHNHLGGNVPFQVRAGAMVALIESFNLLLKEVAAGTEAGTEQELMRAVHEQLKAGGSGVMLIDGRTTGTRCDPRRN